MKKQVDRLEFVEGKVIMSENVYDKHLYACEELDIDVIITILS